jgi:cation/acetate symporter
MSQDRFQRAGIDGRFAFALATLLGGIGLLCLMGRVGVPDGLVHALAILFVLAGLAIVGALLRTMRVSWFYAASRAVPAPYAGFAMAGLGAALFLPFMPPVPQGTSLTELFAGAACGMACAGLVTGPFLRKTGAFSIPDLITERFPHLSARLGAILLTTTVTLLLALAGYQEAASSLVTLGGLSPALALAIVAGLLIVIVLPGGLAGALWTATAAAVIAVSVFGLPLLITALQGEPLAFPIFGRTDLWADAVMHVEAWTGAADAKEHLNPALIATIAVGLGVLAPLLGVSIACEDRRSAQRAGFAALCWGGIMILIAAATLAQASLSLDHALVGQTPDALASNFYRASGKGELSICGADVADTLTARHACASRPGFSSALRMQDIKMSGHYLLTSFADIGGFASAFSGLVAAGLAALGLGLAAIGIQSAATVLGNDLFYRVRDHSALTSRRLAVTRTFAIAAIAVCRIGLSLFNLDPRILIALALLLSAAGLAPLLALTLWPRATSFDATVALLMGLFMAEALIGMPFESGIERIAASAMIACLSGFGAGLLTSFARRRTNDEGSTLVRAMISERSEWLHPDKGA